MKNAKLEELKNAINEQAVFICERLGIDTSGKNFSCPSGTHPDKKPSAHFYEGFIKCFTCGINWDCVSIIQNYHRVDFKTALQIGGDMLGLETGFLGLASTGAVKSSPPLPKPPKTAVKTVSKGGIMNNEQVELNEVKKNATESIGKRGVDYLKGRGIDFVTALKVGVLESDNFVHPKVALKKPDSKGYPALLFPVQSIEGVVTGYIARWTTENKPEGKVQNVAGEGGLFGVQALLQDKEPVFLTEGEIDCLTFVDAGYRACSFGSTSGVSKLLSILSQLVENGAKLPPLIVAPDNDKQGLQALKKIEDGLKSLNVDYKVLASFGTYKDANEAYTKDKPAFMKALLTVVKTYEPATESLNNTIARLFNEPSPKPLSTGFENLDLILSKGLRAGGLTVVFGNPATGKTAFVLQIADNIAKSGNDYLYFSLEMTKKELLCRSLSRESLILALNAFDKENRGKDGITLEKLIHRPPFIKNNALSQHYFSEAYVRGGNDNKNAIATASIESYLSKAENRATVCSGMFDVTIERIKRELDSYKALRGKYPALAIVDYVQIIAPPEDEKAPKTDKQVADYNIKELKKLAGAYQIPFLVIASVNRESYKSDNREGLTIASAKESGGIEYTADVILGLEVETRPKPKADKNIVSPENYEQLEGGEKVKDKTTGEGFVLSKLIRCKVFKNRWGIRGRAYFDYKPKYHFFRMVEKATVTKIMEHLTKEKKYLYTGNPAEEILIEGQKELVNHYF